MKTFALLALAIALAGQPAAAAPNDQPPESLPLYEGEGGASCSHYLGDVLPWQKRGGDWRDRVGNAFGDAPFAIASPGPEGTIWDVSSLVRGWFDRPGRSGIIYLRPVSGSGHATFHSRDARGVSDRPMLVLEFAGGRRELRKPTADTHLDCSTYRSLGYNEVLTISAQHSALLQFELPAAAAATLVRARLVLSGIGSGGNLRVGAFEALVPQIASAPLRLGLAAQFPGDRGIERQPDVVFVSGFEEGRAWRERWARDGGGEIAVVTEDPDLRFRPLAGAALRVNMKKGSNLGGDLRLNFREHGGEPDELYFRYYLRFADDWNPQVASGKLPGLAGTYGRAGWGGRKVNGSDGWSARGAFLKSPPPGHPLAGFNLVGSYVYHAEMAGTYGDIWPWPAALLKRNRWYSVEQQVRLNRPGSADGLIRAWIDGRLVMERNGIRFRNVERLHIESLWMNVYHGGSETSPHDQHLYIDNVVVARRYIGPMTDATGAPAKYGD